MFETLRDLSPQQIESVVDALAADTRIAVLVDPGGVYVAFTSTETTGLPYEVDVDVVSDPVAMTPFGMVRSNHDKLMPWMRRSVMAICRRWKEKHPVPRTPEA